MKVIVFGATGMVGRGVLLECLEDDAVSHVLAVGRRSAGVEHDKFTEVLHDNFVDYSDIGDAMAGFDACFFCLGVSSVGMSEAQYHRVTYEFTLAAINPRLVFCYVSAEGADSSEGGRVMWARVRGKTENDLLALPLGGAYVFRIGYVHPMKGVTAQVSWVRILYTMFRPLYPIVRRLFPRHVTTSENIGRAMIRIAQQGYSATLLRSDDINVLARA